jgi:hypothetical protein
MMEIDEPPREPPLAEMHEVLSSFEEFEQRFRTNHPIAWLATLAGPFVVTGLVLASVAIFAGADYAWRLVVTAVVTFFFFGRFVILGGHEGELGDVAGFMTAEQLFLLVTYLDVMIAVLLAFHIGFLFKLPILGRRIRELVADGQFILKYHSWMKRATFIGLVAFIMFPVAATGSVGGSIFGRLLGLGRVATCAGIVLGSVLGNGVMYLGSDLINAYVDKDHPVVKYGGVLAIVVIIVILERRYRKLKRIFLNTQDRGAD